jgi:enamine deaminase RidA (YjgF/YER057c/UK114 family)
MILKGPEVTSAIQRKITNATSYADMVTTDGTGQWVFIAGQLAFDANRNIVGADVDSQADRCFDRIESLLRDAGGDLTNVVSITTYLTDLADYEKFDRVRSERFPNDPPASAAVMVAGLLFGALIEISAIGFIPSGQGAGV